MPVSMNIGLEQNLLSSRENEGIDLHLLQYRVSPQKEQF